MSEFLFLYRGTGISGSPEETQRYMEKWTSWFKGLEAQGRVRNIGNPLERTSRLVSGKQKIVHDGPYAEAKDAISGYSLVEADDLTHAVDLSKGCPILEIGGDVEVRPIRVMNM
jgi:hypothetical protein